MKHVNIAVVAFGKIAKTHVLAAYMANLKLNLPFELKVTHIVTSRPYDIPFSNIIICKTLDEALSRGPVIDIVDICNINEAHYETIQIAAKAKKAIYCEKPLTDSLKHSQEICQLIEAEQLLTGVPLVFRYIPALHMLKEELKKKRFGEVIHFECRYNHDGYLDEKKRKTWRTMKSSGGGASIDLGIHMIDCVRFLFESVVHIEGSVYKYFLDSETDEIYRASVQLRNHGTGEILASRIFTQQKQMAQFEVFCEKGSFFCDLTTPYVLQCKGFQGDTIIEKPQLSAPYMKYIVQECFATQYHLDAHMCCLADFARNVFDGNSGKYFADFMEAYESQKMIGLTS